MKKPLTSFLLIIAIHSLYAQHQDLNERPGLWKEKSSPEDSTSVLSAFRRGNVNGHFRYYLMATDNATGLSDYYANAIGGGIRFETAPFKNFQIAVSGFFTFNIGSSNLERPDEATGQMNRYEISLFDIENPKNKSDIDRLEELYIKYQNKKTRIILGKQLLNNPFINLQDGRMRPTEVEGLHVESSHPGKTSIEADILYGIAPRGTVKWYRIGESIGVYPQGVTSTGLKSGYSGNLDSKWIALMGIKHNISDNLKLQVWNLYTDNIFNSILLQADYNVTFPGKNNFYAGAQAIRQDAVRDGGNEDPNLAYFDKGSKSFSFGSRVGWKNEIWNISINHNRITAIGRYLIPREWGRDPFFTFMPRERNEGAGDVKAWMAKFAYFMKKGRLKTELAIGHFDMPDVTNFSLNKYGLPSYAQLNLDTRYDFSGLLKGFDLQLLYVYKARTGSTYGNNKYVINKVNMSIFHAILNYRF